MSVSSARLLLSAGSLRGSTTLQASASKWSCMRDSFFRQAGLQKTAVSAFPSGQGSGLRWRGSYKGPAAGKQKGENSALFGHAEPTGEVGFGDPNLLPERSSAVGQEDFGSTADNANDTLSPSEWRFGAGIWKDLRRRLPNYASDFADGFHPKAIASVFFLYFACLAPCIAFGGLLSHVTGGSIGVVETIVGTAGSGIVYALTAGQPLTLLGPTGLMVVFSGLLYKVTCQLNLPFLPVYGWVGIWSCVFLLLLAALEASNLIRHFTRFTDETFSALISLGYISEAWKSIQRLFRSTSSYPMESAFLSLVLAGGTWRLATFLTELKNSRLLVRPVRNALADFGPPLAILLMAAASHLVFPTIVLPQLAIPATFSTTSGRAWVVPLMNIPPWAWAASAIPAALLTLLVFLDQQ